MSAPFSEFMQSIAKTFILRKFTNEFMTALQAHLITQQPNYPNNAKSILEVLFNAYSESIGFDNAAIESDFKELYRLMNDKPLKEIDEIIYTVCNLCRDHVKAGFIEGIKVGMSLAKELVVFYK